MGKAVKTVAKVGLAPVTGGASLLGGGKLMNSLFGRKDRGRAASWLDLDPSLKKSVEAARAGQLRTMGDADSELKRLRGFDPTKISNLVTKQKQKGLFQQARDQERRASQAVAQRGLGRSSVGLRAIMKAGDEARKQAQSVAAVDPLQRQRLFTDRAQQIRQIGDIYNRTLGAQGASRTFVKGREAGGRSGGLASIAGAAIGGYMGGPAGAQAGMGMGRAFGNMRI